MSNWILGLNLGHDRSACLLKDGEIFIAIEEERLDRIKHSIGYICSGYFANLVKEIPIRSITYCLDAAGIGLDDLDLVVGNCATKDVSVDLLRNTLPIKNKNKIIQLPDPSHHLAHAYNAYYASGFKESAVFVVDGMGSFISSNPEKMEAESMYSVKNGRFEYIGGRIINPEKELSLGLFYNYITTKTGFITKYGKEGFGEFNCGGVPEAGKTMGLSPFGVAIREWPQISELTSEGLIKVPFDKLAKIFELTKLTADISEAGNNYEKKFYMDWSNKIQAELESAIIHMLKHLYEKTGMKNLCLGGGVFLNSVLNYKILKKTPFENIYVFPAVNDAGVAVGCAYYGFYENYCSVAPTARRKVEQVGFGREYSEVEIKTLLDNRNIKYTKTTASEAAALIKSGRIVALFNGRSEFGPRALGHRSILASAQIKDMKDILNKRVKFREPFRPFAPAVVYEDLEKYFELDFHSPHMLFVAPVKEAWRSTLPSITHVDGTARLQTVKSEVGVLYDILQEYKKQTGVSVILNTSFNVAGQPIVESPSEAVDTFMSTDIDDLIIWPYIVSKEEKK